MPSTAISRNRSLLQCLPVLLSSRFRVSADWFALGQVGHDWFKAWLSAHGGGLSGLRLEQQVEMARHQVPADEQKAQPLARLREPLHKATANALAEKHRCPSIGAGGDESELSWAVKALVQGTIRRGLQPRMVGSPHGNLVQRHAAEDYTLASPLPEESPPWENRRPASLTGGSAPAGR